MNACESDADCATGSRCDLERAMCVTDPAATLSVGFEVLPASDPYGGTPIPISFPVYDVTGPAERNLPIRGSIPVRGLVHWRLEPITASVTFVLPSEIPGGPTTRVQTQSTGEPVMEEGGRFNYATQLVPDRSYDVIVEPSGEWLSILPPLRLSPFATTNVGTRIEDDLSYPDILTEITGVIVDAEGAEQSGMIVRAHDASGALVSSTYTTGSDPERSPGYFVLRLTPGTAQWLFSINASTDRIVAGGITPTFTVDPGASFPGEAVRIAIPPVSDQVIAYQGTVEAASLPGVGQAATLTFTSADVVDDTTGVIGSFRAMTTTGEDGSFELQLLPGTYEVVITPTNPDLAVHHEQMVRIDPEISELRGQIFAVPDRVRYNGWAQTADSTRMFDARVRSQGRGSTYGDMLPPVAVYARSTETLTDSMGQFDLPLDIGLYDIIVEPPVGTNWPWALERNLPIGGTDGFIQPVIQIGAPVPVSGRVYYEELDGMPAAMAVVRAYAILDEGEGATRTVQIGQATADADGNFTLLLPADP